MTRKAILSATAAVLLASSLVLAQKPRLIDDGLLRRPPAEEWLTYGYNYGEQRHSTLRQINATNVGRLGLGWTTEIGEGGGIQEATPLVANGVMYVVTNWSVVFALDARTGRELWRFDPKVDRVIGTPGPLNRVCCGVVNRGLALYHDRVFVAALDGRLIALEAATGKQVWSVMTVPPNQPYSITMAPRVYKGKVIVGNSGAEYAVRGYVSAYDALDGNWHGVSIRYRATLEAFRASRPCGRRQDLDGRVVEDGRRRHRLGRAGVRSRCRPSLHRRRQRRAVEPGLSRVRAAATICICPRSLRSNPTPVSTSGTTRRRRATTGTTPPCSR